MSKILIAVGGTGQEIALACLRLCHMAGIQGPFVVVVDSDQGAGTSGIPTRTDELQRFAGFLKETRGQDFVVFLKPLADNIRERQVETVRSLFSPAGLTSPVVQDVLSLLFTRDQQETKVIDGFHGKPTVGSVAVDDYMLQGEFKEKFLDLVDTLTKPQTPHFIVLAGSTTGGTGPGVIPPVSRKIVEWRRFLNPPRTIELSGVVQLQWFHPLKDKTVSWSRPPDVDLVRLQQNSACLIRQYDADLAKLLDRLVLLSLPQVIRRVSAGPNHQPETLHWLNVLSGWIATELLQQGQTLDNLARGSLYFYTLDDQASPLASLFFESNGRRISLGRALDASRVLAAFAFALRNQIGRLRLDVALPKTTYRFLRAIGGSDAVGDERVTLFLDTFGRLSKMDEITVNWFRDACASRFRTGDPDSPRDEQDVPDAFKLPPEAVTTDVQSAGRLLNEPMAFEQDFVAFLLHQSKAHAEPAGPETTAVTLYRELRRVLLDRLLRVS